MEVCIGEDELLTSSKPLEYGGVAPTPVTQQQWFEKLQQCFHLKERLNCNRHRSSSSSTSATAAATQATQRDVPPLVESRDACGVAPTVECPLLNGPPGLALPTPCAGGGTGNAACFSAADSVRTRRSSSTACCNSVTSAAASGAT